jgi:hypothetical protein
MPAILFTNGDATTQSVGQIVRQVGSAVFLALADTASNVAKLFVMTTCITIILATIG